MKSTILSLMAVGLLVSANASANLLSNPGFETGNFSGWTTSGSALVTGSCAQTVMGCAPNGGAYFAAFNSSTGQGNASAQQTASLSGPGNYSFGAYVWYGTTNPSGNFEQGQITLGIQLPGGATTTIGFDPNALSGQFVTPGLGAGYWFTNWMLLTGTLTYSGVGPVDALININVQDFSATNTLLFGFDNAFLNAVPEPGTLALLGLGLAGLGLSRRRKAA